MTCTHSIPENFHQMFPIYARNYHCFALAGEDYQSNFIAEIEITQTFGGQMCANISIFDDELVEDREFFILNLSTADEAVVFTTQLAVVMIENNDGEPISRYAIIPVFVL